MVGWHQANNGNSGAKNFDYCCISVNRILKRKTPFAINNWLLDSGAFTRISGLYSYKGHLSTKRYAQEILRWKNNGNLLAAVSQDFMCEPLVLANTGLSIVQHQQLTIKRYDAQIAYVASEELQLTPEQESSLFFEADEEKAIAKLKRAIDLAEAGELEDDYIWLDGEEGEYPEWMESRANSPAVERRERTAQAPWDV